MNIRRIIRTALLSGVVVNSIIAIFGATAGAVLAELPGMLAALIGALAGFVLLGLTPISIGLGLRAGKGDLISPGFFAVVLGTWLLKFIAYLILVFWLGDQSWLDGMTLFFVLATSVLSGLVVEMVVLAKARVPYVSDVELPGESAER